MTHHSASTSGRRAHTIPVGHHLRSRRRDVAVWSLAQGRPVDRDALAVVLNSSTDPNRSDSPDRWTSERVAGLLWEGVLGWCRANSVAPPPPDDVRATLLAYLRYLGEHRLLAEDSDRPAQLRRAVAEHGRTPGGSVRPPVDRRRAPASVTPIA
jgi:hypothetical protein